MPIQSPFRYEDDRNEESILTDEDSPLTDRRKTSDRGAPRVEAPRTFAQMQAAGEARPPMPVTMAPAAYMAAEATPTPWNGTQGAEPSPDRAYTVRRESNRPPRTPNDRRQPNVPGPQQVEPEEEVPSAGGSTGPNDLLEMILAGLRGNGASGELRAALNEAIMAQLAGPNPYNSEAVRSEYEWLAGNIDDDFTQRERATDEGMAARGLYGSAGKDFHSGRLSDLNVGRRSAQTTLAHDLASDYARSEADYRRSAIEQALVGAGAANQEELQWLMTLLGYGQQGFENDMRTAEFNTRQNQDYERLLQMLLGAGYGA